MAIDIIETWANTGDITIIPDDTQPDGSVSFKQGWGNDYQLDPATVSNAKKLSRSNFNYLFSLLTTNQQEQLLYGFNNHIVGKTYPIMARVRGADGLIYESTVETNTTPPSADWIEFGGASGVPVGTIISTNSLSIQDGYLALDGSTGLSRATYADLYNSNPNFFGNGDGSTTFDLPDLRGRFLGGYTDTYNVGTIQEDAIRNITARLGVVANTGVNRGGATVELPPLGISNGFTINDTVNNVLGIDVSEVVPTAEENRPKNIRINWLIKY